MNRFVIDASVAVKWLPLFRDEPLVAAAKHHLNRRSAGDTAVTQRPFRFQSLQWAQHWQAGRAKLRNPLSQG